MPGRSTFLKGSETSTFMPSATRISQSRLPTAPKPMTPAVLPASCRPMLEGGTRPARYSTVDSTTSRQTASIRASAISAVASMKEIPALATSTPLREAAAMSTVRTSSAQRK